MNKLLRSIGNPHLKFFFRKKPVDLHNSYFIWIISDKLFAQLIIFYWYFLGYGGGYGGGYSGGHGYSGEHWYFFLNANLIPEFNKIIEISSEFWVQFNSKQILLIQRMSFFSFVYANTHAILICDNCEIENWFRFKLLTIWSNQQYKNCTFVLPNFNQQFIN